MAVVGLTDMEWQPPIKGARRHFLRDVVVVTNESLPSRTPMLLGVAHIQRMGIVIDMGGRTAYFKPSANALPSAEHPHCVLHGAEPFSFQERSPEVHVREPTGRARWRKWIAILTSHWACAHRRSRTCSSNAETQGQRRRCPLPPYNAGCTVQLRSTHTH
jgi:hypothetical protein